MLRATGTRVSRASHARTSWWPKKCRTTTPAIRITQNVNRAPTSGGRSGCGWSDGIVHSRTRGSSRLSSRCTIQEIAHIVMAIGGERQQAGDEVTPHRLPDAVPEATDHRFPPLLESADHECNIGRRDISIDPESPFLGPQGKNSSDDALSCSSYPGAGAQKSGRVVSIGRVGGDLAVERDHFDGRRLPGQAGAVCLRDFLLLRVHGGHL